MIAKRRSLKEKLSSRQQGGKYLYEKFEKNVSTSYKLAWRMLTTQQREKWCKEWDRIVVRVQVEQVKEKSEIEALLMMPTTIEKRMQEL
jgi:hypothetical protein